MLAADLHEAQISQAKDRIDQFLSLYVAVQNPVRAPDLLQDYQRDLRRLLGTPEPLDPHAVPFNPDDPVRIAQEIRMDPWIGGIVKQVVAAARQRQLDEQGASGPETPKDGAALLQRARQERDRMLRQVRGGRSPIVAPAPVSDLRTYASRRRGGE